MENTVFMTLTNAVKSLENCTGLVPFSKELQQEAKVVLMQYMEMHKKELISESNIFGTITLEANPRHVPVVTAWLAELGAHLIEIRWDKPIRRTSKVRLVYSSYENGIIHDREGMERKSCE